MLGRRWLGVLWMVVAVLACGCICSDQSTFGGGNTTVGNQTAVPVSDHSPAPSPPRVIKYGPAISAGLSHCLALCENGTVIAWPTGQDGDAYGQCDVPPGLTNVTAISAGTFHSVALRENGTVITWGQGWDYAAAQPAIQNATTISAGGGSCLALLENGTVVEWGCCHDLFVPVAATGVVAISAGREHSLALLRNGTVVAWGTNISGECDVPVGLTNVTAISAGCGLSAALQENGTVVTWGYPGRDKTEARHGPTNVKAIAVGLGVVSLLKDGSVVDGTTAPRAIPGMERGVTAISTGGNTDLALVGDTVVEYNPYRPVGPPWEPSIRRISLTPPQ